MPAPLDSRSASLWFFLQLFQGHASREHFILFRAIHNPAPLTTDAGHVKRPASKTKAQFLVPVLGFRESYTRPGGIFDQLKALNEDPAEPSNIYHGTALRCRSDGKQDKSACIGFTSLFLDADFSEHMTMEDRRNQLAYMHHCCFRPSMTIFSGHGFHPYWNLLSRIDTLIGEPILKNMIQLSVCRGTGNCADVTRLLRTPGFKNVKYWYDGNMPECVIVEPGPEVILAQLERKELSTRYDHKVFEAFPPAGKDQIAAFYRQAIEIGGSRMETFKELGAAVAGHEHAERINKAADVVKEAGQKPVADPNAKQTADRTTPIYTKVPLDLDDIAVKPGNSRWFKTYCRNGIEGFTPGALMELVKKFGIHCAENGEPGELTSSELDAKVMYQLIRAQFTFDAIDEFWHRGDLKLHRPEKIAKSPDYLRRTYESMFAYYASAMEIKADIEEEESRGLPPDTVFTDEKGYLRIMRAKGKSELLISGNMILKEKYLDLDEPVDGRQEYLHMEVSEYTGKKVDWTTQRIAFTNLRAFREVCHGGVFALAKRDSDLNHMLFHLYSQANGVPMGKFNSVIRYIPEEHKISFPQYVVSKDGIHCHNNPNLIAVMVKQLPLCRNWLAEVPPATQAYKEFNDVWPAMLKIHIPRFLAACLGSIMITAMRRIFQAHSGVSLALPAVNLRGTSCSGKTETLAQIMRVTGTINPREQRLSANSSQFGLVKAMEKIQILPLCIDEFKEEDEGIGKNLHMQTIRQLVRNSYSGETLAKGRADQSMVCQIVMASLIISGESALERSGHLAELTRILPVDTDSWDVRLSRDAYDQVRRSHLEWIGPYLYSWMLGLDPAKEWEIFMQMEKKFSQMLEPHFGRLSTRAGTNATCTLYGCALWDRFLASINPRLPRLHQNIDLEDEIVHYLVRQAARSGNLIRTERRGTTHVHTRDEAWDWIDTLGKMVANRDRAISELEERDTPLYAISADNRHLYLFPQLAYDAYRQYSLRLNYQSFLLPTIMARLHAAHHSGEAWVVNPEAVYNKPGRAPQKAIALDLEILRGAGYWPQAVPDGNRDGLPTDVFADA